MRSTNCSLVLKPAPNRHDGGARNASDEDEALHKKRHDQEARVRSCCVTRFSSGVKDNDTIEIEVEEAAPRRSCR